MCSESSGTSRRIYPRFDILLTTPQEVSLAMKRKFDSTQTTLASDSESEGEGDRPHITEEDLYHRGFREDGSGHTRLVVTKVVVPASPTKARRPERETLHVDSEIPSMLDDAPLPFAGEDFFAFDETHPVDSGPRKERDSVSTSARGAVRALKLIKDNPMGQWLRNRRERFLDELLRLEGRGDHRYQTKCSTCPEVASMVYRCEDCFTDALFCQQCVVTAHRDNPLHRVEVYLHFDAPSRVLTDRGCRCGGMDVSLRALA
jgi:hypothetical protein